MASTVSPVMSASSRQCPSQISRIYRQASTLFLTRRLPESLSTILPIIKSPSCDFDLNVNAPGNEPALISSASRTTRIKIWSLYLTILNAIVELDSEEGKQTFGVHEWRAIVTKVRDGDVWDEVIKNGYRGVEGNVDSEVVINLTTLLLAHGRNQVVNQQRLENYLAISMPKLDISHQIQAPQTHEYPKRGVSPSSGSGTNTPRDLNARVKIIELYTLHVLLRNNEWDYAREFILMSEVLDEERREAFLEALHSLHDEHNKIIQTKQEEQRRQEGRLQKDIEEARQRRTEKEDSERQKRAQERPRSNKTSSEVDYGIESSCPNGSVNGSTKAHSKGMSKKARSNDDFVSHSAGPSASGKKSATSLSLFRGAGEIITKLLDSMTTIFKGDPLIFLRTIAFIVAFLLILSRSGIRDRVKQTVRKAWAKVRATVGMGIKISYI